MKRILFIFTAMVQCLVAPYASEAAPLRIPVSYSPQTMTVEPTLVGHVATWSASSGAGDYHLRVVNVSTGHLHTVISTQNTSAVVSGLASGNTYRFTLTKGTSNIIIEDIIVSD